MKKTALFILLLTLCALLCSACRSDSNSPGTLGSEQPTTESSGYSEPTSPENSEAATQQPTQNTEPSIGQTQTPSTEPAECSHTFGQWVTTKLANCKEAGERTRTCSHCAAQEKEVLPRNDAHTPVTDPAVAATCKSTGLTEGSHCSVCEKVLVAQTTLPMTDVHTPVTDAAVAATCKSTGLTEGSHCSVCEKVLVAQTTLPMTDVHTPVTDAAVAATCKSTGLTEGSHCSVCKLVLVAQTTIPKTEHHYVDNLCDCGAYVESQGLAFTKSGSGCTLSGIGTCHDARIVVPATYAGLPVKYIAADAFKSVNSFYEIVLPSSITSIGPRAFAYCKNLKTIAIPDGVQYLEIETFAECKALETVELPAQLLQIMERCFTGCTSLKNIELPKELIKIREYAFMDCRKLETITLPTSLNEIQQFAFYDCTALSIKYAGMKWQFKQLSKGFEWCGNVWSNVIACKDGDCDFDGNSVNW